MCAHHNIPVWDLQNREGFYEMNVSISGFYQMKPICRKTGSRVKIIKKYGLPFFFLPEQKKKGIFYRHSGRIFSAHGIVPAYLEHSCGGKPPQQHADHTQLSG
ncbi:sporulation protein YqfD [Blautia sp.]|uniref:sporulation protein YqfD n=1 Tax=Blautia sp. TaxID=1955243 RepID=UPI003994B4D8